VEIYTIGSERRSAEDFFQTLREVRVRRLVDVRLRNVSQLAGFTKRGDLRFFLKELCDASYVHELLLAPTAELLDSYRKRRIPWSDYEEAFLRLLSERSVDTLLSREEFHGPSVLLCSESKPAKCHRRLVAEFLREKWGDIDIIHL
jgi:uncharacterized protein (DUF488 family)